MSFTQQNSWFSCCSVCWCLSAEAVEYPDLVEYTPDCKGCQTEISYAPLVLGLMVWICDASNGKISSSLRRFHLRSDVRRSETRKSNTSSVQGPIGFTFFSKEIQESCHTFVDIPFPIAFPRCGFRSSRPWRMLRHPWEHTVGTDTSKMLLLWQYFPSKILVSRQLGTVRILHASFANRTWLNSWMSRRPSPPSAFGFVRVSQETQHIFLFPSGPSHQNLVNADRILLP